MRLVLTGRNVEITPPLRQIVDSKLAKLDRMLHDSIISAMVVLTREKYRHVAEVTVHARGDHMLHALGDATAWRLSINQAVEKIAKQAGRMKDRWRTRKRQAIGARKMEALTTERQHRLRPPPPRRAVRASRYPIKPMTVDDAATRLERGQDAFLVFRNLETDGVNIVFRRKDGRLALIDPDAQ